MFLILSLRNYVIALFLFRFNTFVNIDFDHILILCFYLMMLDGFLAKYCIYIFQSLNKVNQHETSRDFIFITLFLFFFLFHNDNKINN